MKTRIAPILLSLAFSTQAYGNIQALLLQVSTNTTFTVPAGKVLVIQNLKLRNNSLVLKSGTNSLDIGFDDFPGGTTGAPPLAFPIRIPDGWTLSCTNPSNPSTTISVFALLIDTSDLYASIQNKIDQISVQGSTVSLGIRTASARPARIAVERSSQLGQGWEVANDAAVYPTGDKTKYTATVPTKGDKEFFRTKAVPLN